MVESHPFHVTRDAEVAIQELESDDLLETVEDAVWRRRFRKPVRLQTDSAISARFSKFWSENLDVEPDEVCRIRDRWIFRACGNFRIWIVPNYATRRWSLGRRNFSPLTPTKISFQ